LQGSILDIAEAGLPIIGNGDTGCLAVHFGRLRDLGIDPGFCRFVCTGNIAKDPVLVRAIGYPGEIGR
jgi:hypothetical protein